MQEGGTGKDVAPQEYSRFATAEYSQAKLVARWVALGALFLIPLAPLVVVNSLFFPFITGKAFFFRILVEVAVCAWLALAALDVRYRPRFSWIGAAVLAFTLWMFVADLFAINVLKAFWSNFERMEGWVLLAHLCGFFFAASSVLGVEKRWRTWFLTSLAVSAVVSLYALLQLGGVFAIHQGATRVDATMGNSAYFGIYLLFNVFVAGWLALTEERVWLARALIALAALQGFLVFMTETRGTVLGLISGLILASLLAALTGGKRVRQGAVAALLLLVLVSGGVYLARESSFVQTNHTLERVTSISFADLRVRLMIWQIALTGVAERPLVGYGQEGFNYVFNEHYNPALYEQEPWFDRAHNAFIDWLVAGGVPAFLLYLALFGTAILMLWTHSTLSRPERIALTAALAGYAVHNLVVFDNLYAYVYFFAILALIDSQIGRPVKKLEELPQMEETFALPMAAALALVLIYTVNITGMQASTKLIAALSPQASVAVNLQIFQELAASRPFALQEVREQIISFSSRSVGNNAVSAELQQQIASFAVAQMSAQNVEHPGDARTLLQLAVAYRTAGDLKNSLKAIEEALKLSPNKPQVYVQAGATQMELGDAAAARAMFHQAYALGPEFKDLAAYAAAGDFLAGDVAAANKLLLEVFATTTVDSEALAIVYYRTKNWPSLIRLWELRTRAENAAPNTYFSLAASHYLSGDKAKAIAVVEEAMRRFPDAAQQGKQLITQIQSAPSQ